MKEQMWYKLYCLMGV